MCGGLKRRQGILISYINLALMEVLAKEGGTYMSETNVLNGRCRQKPKLSCYKFIGHLCNM